MDKDTAIILTQSKSLGVGLLLTFLFGGLGVLYVSILGGILLGVLEVIAVVITVATFGIGIVLLIPIHIAAFIWVIVGVKNHNNRLIAGMSSPATAIATE